MPAASYREGPDGHSSRKQNSKRRRAKCSPSFVSGRVIGHGDIPPRCVPECSAMALHRAVPAARPSRASTLSFVLLAGRSPSPAFGAVFFCGEGGSYLVRGESRRSSMARSSRMRSRATGSGNILARCVPKRLSVARFRRGAFPGINPWQVLRSVHPKSGLGRENRQFAARFARHASENGLALAGYARHASEKPRKPPFGNAPREDLARKGRFSLHGPLESCTARRSCHPSWRQTARAPATPVPPTSAKPPERPRPRHRRTVRAARARSPGPRNTAREAAPPSLPGQQVPPAAPAPPPPLFANTSQ